MAESKFALAYANERGNAAAGLAVPDGLGNPLLDLNLTMALASADIRLLTQEQIKLRELLVSQQSLFKVVTAPPAANSEPKSKLKAEIEQRPPPKRLQSAMANETALVELNQVLHLSTKSLQALSEKNLEIASDKRVAPSGATGADLLQVQLAGLRSGISDGLKGEQKTEALQDFSRDAAVNASAFKMDVKAAGEMLSGWRTTLKLDRVQSQDLADATNYLGNSGLNVKAADIGSVVQSAGEDAKAAGMTPEQVAALAAAFLNSGADKTDAGAALKSFTTVLGKGESASSAQRSAWADIGLNPESLAHGMSGNAPKTIELVLKQLKQQPEEKQASLTKTLFGNNDAILELLKKPEDVQTAFKLVADKSLYAGSTGKTAEAYGNTSQGRWNALDASLNRLSTAVGNALAPVTDGIAIGLTAVVNGLSAAAETFPFVTAALTLLGVAATPFVAGALKTGVSAVLDAVSTRLLRLAAARLPSEVGDMLTGDDDNGGGRKKKRSSRKSGQGKQAKASAKSAQPSKPAVRQSLGNRLRGAAMKVMPSIKRAAARVLPAVRSAGAKVLPAMRSAGAKVMPAVRSFGAKVMPMLSRMGPLAGKVAVPLMVAHAAYTGLKGVREGDEKAVGSAKGELAGTAIGALVGSFILPGFGTAIGSIAGGYFGSLLGEALADPPADKLAAPGDVAKNLVNAPTQSQNQQVTFSPLIQVTCPAPDTAEQIRSIIGQQLSGQFHGEFLPLLTNNPLATRRDAALTDGVAR
ncbi:MULTISPECIES: phage tail tape measure protein [Pseudomonas]|uniref:Phage tail tape measure protein n=1 Tax=Pseudomonas aphyarum TaxID=2942629 RepID=A0ABT5PX07_9PSED|nr:phage tail tape measure protein [Pseudomonas aphyarum]MDD0967238.1 phage tail tape measure protein [Pseudomonas aphyarum]MDD1128011.1 phage tail tape measure protein [Pseudomonas aphyarum]